MRLSLGSKGWSSHPPPFTLYSGAKVALERGKYHIRVIEMGFLIPKICFYIPNILTSLQCN